MHSYGSDEMSTFGPNDCIFIGLGNISFLSKLSLTSFVKEVFGLKAQVRLWGNEHIVIKWLHIYWFKKFCKCTNLACKDKRLPFLLKELLKLWQNEQLSLRRQQYDCDEMNILWQNYSIFSDLHDISFICGYYSTAF